MEYLGNKGITSSTYSQLIYVCMYYFILELFENKYIIFIYYNLYIIYYIYITYTIYHIINILCDIIIYII